MSHEIKRTTDARREGRSWIKANTGRNGWLLRSIALLIVLANAPSGLPVIASDQIREESKAIVPGRFGQALNAAQGRHLAPADRRFGQPPLTVELWAKLTEGAGERVLVANGLRNSQLYWELVVRDDGRLTALLGGFHPSVIISGRTLETGQWHHIAMVLQPDQVQLFVDGEPVSTTALTPRHGPAPIGALGIGTRLEERRLSAVLLDEVRISAGVRDIIAAPRQPLIQDRTTLGLWAFEECEEDYMARWTPGGETNQRDLPYPHRVGEYEFESDEHWVDGRWQQTEKGPFLTHSTRIPGYEVGVKTATVVLGDPQQAAVLFDLERCTATAGLTAVQLRIDPARFGLLRKPVLDGTMQFHLPPIKAWRQGPSADMVPGIPLDSSQVRYRGLHLHGQRVLFRFQILGADVLDTSWIESQGQLIAITRSMESAGIPGHTALTLAEMPAEPRMIREDELSIAWCTVDGVRSAVAMVDRAGGELVIYGRDVLLALSKDVSVATKWLAWTGPDAQWNTFLDLVRRSPKVEPLRALEEPAARRWGEPLVTRGSVAADGSDPHVIDTITVPYENPHRALFFIGGLDFFPNGDAAICTAHGDVWIVRGLDSSLDGITWQRFATGLYQPLGLRVVDGHVIVLGRDQLTRLHDLNGNGEADFYESFNQDLQIQGQDHAYATRLEIDSQGHFYFLKSGSGPHGSALLKVFPDGSRLELVASGFRHPYGMGVGPHDQITVADNEGNWVPSSKIDLIEPGGFYGFRAGDAEAADGLVPNRPLCYIPKIADNSSGGQVWVPDDRWGGLNGQMLHLSWGRCTLHVVLREQIGHVWQAATAQFPGLTFLSGPGEGRFHPVDGQLYVVGLTGWQTGAAADGSFQRVRYTGRPVNMPEAFHVHENGLRVRFTQPVNPIAAERRSSYRIELWNYRWSATYGSFHYSVRRPAEIGHDTLHVTAAHLLPDGRTVFLEVPDLQPVDQIHLHVDLEIMDGHPLRFDLYGTIHALGPLFHAPPAASTRDR